MIPLLPFPDSFFLKHTFLGRLTFQTKKSLFLVFCLCHKEIAAPAEDVGAPVRFLNPKPGNEVEELGLADGMFFAPLTIEGPEEANGKAADTWAWWCLGW